MGPPGLIVGRVSDAEDDWELLVPDDEVLEPPMVELSEPDDEVLEPLMAELPEPDD